MTKDNNFRLEFPTDTEVMGADMSEPPKPPTVASQESDVNGVSDFSVFEGYGDYSNEIPVPPKNTGKIVAIVIAAIVVIALIGGIACWMLSNNSKKSAITSAAAQCQDSTSQLQSANNTLSDALEIGKTGAKVTADQVADVSTVTKLNAAISNAKEAKILSCDTSQGISKLKKSAKAMASEARSMNDKAEKITNAAEAVDASKVLATQNRLKGQLNDAIEQAQSVLDNSDGMVADDSVRVALQQAFRARTRMGPMEYFSCMKAEQAALLLTQGYGPGETARMLGYGSLAWFSRRFHALTGQTPGAYRRAPHPLHLCER